MTIPKPVVEIIEILNEKGHDAFLVGGSVRDLILGIEPKDWDICTTALPEKVSDSFDRVVPTGIEFGTVTVMVDGEGFEVTTLRGDGNYSDGRRPDEVCFITDLKKDLSRRDFTINAMAFDPVKDELHDPFGGEKDLKAGIIRAVGNPEDRFMEDGLRVMRAIRFASRFDFKIDSQTLTAIRDCSSTLSKVSPERIHDEFMKILSSKFVAKGLRFLKITGLFKFFCPEIIESFDCGQNHFHDFDVWIHTVRCIEDIPMDRPLVRLAAFLHDIGKPRVKEFSEKRQEFAFIHHEKESAIITEDFLRRMKFSNDEREFVVHLVRNHMADQSGHDMSNAGVRRFIKKIGKDNLKDFFVLSHADKVATRSAGIPDLDKERFLAFKARVAEQKNFTPSQGTRSLEIDGRDIMEALGIKPGPEVGLVLNALLEHILDHPEDNNRETLGKLIFEVRKCNLIERG